MNGYRIPFIGLDRQYKNLKSEILAATDTVLRSGVLMDGEHTQRFESWLAGKNRTRYALTCHSGTQALELLAQYYITEFKERAAPVVGIPALTYPATANAWIRAGWQVRFIDVDRDGIIDFTTLADGPMHALVLVGLYGAAVYDIGPSSFQSQIVMNDIVLVEDAAQHWLSSNCRRLGHSAAISFDPTKNLSANGNGGAVVTHDESVYDTLKSMANNGKPHHDLLGTNTRMSELDCAHLLVKTQYLDAWQDRRRKIAEHYLKALSGLPVRCLISNENLNDHCFHKFVIDTDRRNELQAYLAHAGIETKVHYAHPLHELPAFSHYSSPGVMGVASCLSRRVLSLPIYPELADSEIEQITDRVRAFFS